MRAVLDLVKLQHAAVRRLLVLKLLADGFKCPIAAEHDRIVSFAVIECLHLWASFSRSFYLSCFLKARRTSGARVAISTSGIKSTSNAIDFSIRQLKPRLASKKSAPWHPLDEPTWRKPGTLLELFNAGGASNLAQVQAAFGMPTTVFDDLPRARNFFAHRSEYTAKESRFVASNLGVNANLRPSEVLCTFRAGRPQNVLCDWIDDLRIVVELICQ